MGAAAALNGQLLLPEGALQAITSALESGESIRVVIQRTFASALAATDRSVFIWEKGRPHVFPWEHISDVVFGRGRLARWVQVRGPSIGLTAPLTFSSGSSDVAPENDLRFYLHRRPAFTKVRETTGRLMSPRRKPR